MSDRTDNQATSWGGLAVSSLIAGVVAFVVTQVILVVIA